VYQSDAIRVAAMRMGCIESRAIPIVFVYLDFLQRHSADQIRVNC
jgi:hypothetical protein